MTKQHFNCLRLVLALGLLSLAGTARAQSQPYTPQTGGIERKAIMDALRKPVQRELAQDIIFRVNWLKAQNGWAFLRGTPEQPGGRPVNYHGTRYQEAIQNGMFGGDIVALLHKTGGRWRVVTYDLGPTDVPYEDWDTRYHAPHAIFGLR